MLSGKDLAGNQSGVSTLTVANIDRVAPTIVYGTNGSSSTRIASTKVTVSDLNGIGVDENILEYVWDTQNSTIPTNGWATFVNGATVQNNNTSGIYYLWVRAKDKLSNALVSKSEAFNIVNTLPTASITMTPNTGITTATSISWSYANSTDPDGDSIVSGEWQLDTNAVTTSPNGLITVEGTHTMKLRVKDSTGMWSNWVTTTFSVGSQMLSVYWNPLDKGSYITLSDNNTTATNSTGGWGASLVRANVSKKSGKWYFEVKHLSGPTNQYFMVGVGGSDVTSDPSMALSNNCVVYYPNFPINSIIGVAVDIDNRTVQIYQDGVLMSGRWRDVFPPAGTNIYPLITIYSGSYSVNFGASAFSYTVPSGYRAYTGQ